jgi:2-keto-4-pentenoate hydratase
VSLRTRVTIDGAIVGEGSAEIPREPLDALLFLTGHLASRNRFVRAGDWVCCGATTGLHAVEPGSVVSAQFDIAGEIVVGVVASSAPAHLSDAPSRPVPA